jgi:hypothetical protein
VAATSNKTRMGIVGVSPLAATMIACAPNWGASFDRVYQPDRANGANLLTITRP